MTKMKLVLIPAGDFMMGSPSSEIGRLAFEEELHAVEISRPFYLSETPVTQEQWQNVMGSAPWCNSPYKKSGVDLPVNHVTWFEANDFCQKLSERESREYRLPTEAEWEWACRAGATGSYCYGDNPDNLASYAYFCQQELGSVRQKLPNRWGLYDMHGGMAEWCQDWMKGKYYSDSPRIDPPGPAEGVRRVYRGGSWFDAAEKCRAASRNGIPPDTSCFTVGFRVACNP